MEEKFKNAAEFALMQTNSKDVKAFFCELMLTLENDICPHYYGMFSSIIAAFERLEAATANEAA